MHKTLYVDVDEEITSIIDRIRMEEVPEIFLVVPKQAMLTQGVINLKILKKEIEKIGKSVMIATSDAHARRVIEQIGIKIGEITRDVEENIPKRESASQTNEERLSERAADEAMEKISQEQVPDTDTETGEEKSAADIGSDSFFDAASAHEQFSSELEQKESAFPLSESSEKEESEESDGSAQKKGNVFKGEDLRKKLYEKKEIPQRRLQVSQGIGARSGSFMTNEANRVDLAAGGQRKEVNQQGRKIDQINQSRSGSLGQQGQRVFAKAQKVSVSGKDPKVRNLFGGFEQQDYQIKPSRGLGFGRKINQEKADRFFSGRAAEAGQGKNILDEEKRRIKSELKKEEDKKKSAFFWKVALPLLVAFFALGGLGFWAYSNYPKVAVSIYPKKEELAKEIKIVAKEVSSVDFDEETIPGSFVEMELEKVMNFDATGEAFESDDGKARGKVKIFNLFSASEQPLVKTTRVLSKEGKLFRLTGDVVVPGMSGGEPGVVEAGVISDESGEDFNIPPSTFTIEGFKGNPKYEKFEVKSEVSMANGGEPDSNKKMTAVTASDIEKARIATVEAFEKSLEADIAQKLEEDQRMMFDSIEKEIVFAGASHKTDDTTSQFSYTVKQKIRGIAFNAFEVNSIAEKSLQGDVNSGYALDSAIEVTFKKGISDCEAKTLTMYVNAKAFAWPSIDSEEIAGGIAGKSEQEIKTFLADYPQIEKVEISINPSWMTTVPASKEKIRITEEK